MIHARLTGLTYHGSHDVARARCDLAFKRGEEFVDINVPLIDAIEFCSYIEHLRGRTGHSALRVLCASAAGPPSIARPGARAALARISRRVDVMERDAFLARLWERAVNDDLAVAVGDSIQPELGLDTVGHILNREFRVGWRAKDGGVFYEQWDSFVTAAEEKGGREAVSARVLSLIESVSPTDLHRRIAQLPITNFIDCSIGRTLTKALLAVGKQPIIHGGNSMRLGEWEVSDIDRPHVFYVIGTPGDRWKSLHSLIANKNEGHVENVLDMLRRKDLLLMDFHAFEAEYVLRLPYWAADTGKIVNCAPRDNQPDYWARRGVYVSEMGPDEFLDGLLPAVGARYGALDLLTPPDMLIDLARKKPHDCFISYSRVDGVFAEQLDQDLRRHGARTWRDVTRMKPGNPIGDTIKTELAKAHAFVVVLSPEALSSEWVTVEIRHALSLHASGELETIVPIWYRDCEIPDSLKAFNYVDARETALHATAFANIATEVRASAARAANKLR